MLNTSKQYENIWTVCATATECFPTIYVARRVFSLSLIFNNSEGNSARTTIPRSMSLCLDRFVITSSHCIDEQWRSDDKRRTISMLYVRIRWCITTTTKILNNAAIQANSRYLGRKMTSILASTYIILRGLVVSIL